MAGLVNAHVPDEPAVPDEPVFFSSPTPPGNEQDSPRSPIQEKEQDLETLERNLEEEEPKLLRNEVSSETEIPDVSPNV